MDGFLLDRDSQAVEVRDVALQNYTRVLAGLPPIFDDPMRIVGGNDAVERR